MYGDITWTAYIGDDVPKKHMEVFQCVTGARDAAVELMEKAHAEGKELQGWELDAEARRYITKRGYGNISVIGLDTAWGKKFTATQST